MPKGRAGAKQKAQKSGPSASNWGSLFVRSSDFARDMVDEDYVDQPQFFRGFAQSSRPVKSHPSALKLRHQPIAFVSSSTNLTVESELENKLRLSEEKEIYVAAEDSDSAGEDELEDIEVEFELESDIQTNLMVETTPDTIAQTGPSLEVNRVTDMAQQEEGTLPFVVDTKGDPDLANSFKQSAPRPSSPAGSDSSEEVVVFHGRSKPSNTSTPSSATKFQDRRPASQEQRPSTENFQPARFEPRPQAQHTTQATAPRVPPAQPAKGWASKPSKTDAEVNPDATWAPAPSHPYWKKNKAKPGPSMPDRASPLPQQQKIRDTPAKHGKTSSAIPQGDGAADDDFIDDETFKKIERLAKISRVQAKDDANPPTKEKKIAKMQTRISNIAMLESELRPEHIELARRMGVEEAMRIDEAALARALGKGRESLHTSYGSDHSDAEDTIASLQADWKGVLREKGKLKGSARGGKRGRKKDNQALRQPIVSDEELSLDEEAYNDYMENLVMEAENEEGEDLEEKEYAAGMMNSDESSESTGPIGQDRSDLSSSDLEDDLEYTEQQQWEDEEDLRRRRQERMTDEQIARIFAKQEELGIYGDEMVIENGEYGSFSDGFGDVTAARAGLANISEYTLGRRSNKHGMRRRNNHGDFNFPDASALADSVEQYGQNGFDIMDFDRPSLRPKQKGRRGEPPPELESISDEELRDTMIDAWDNDRAKKRLKKAEREELRAQGLLGATGKKGKSDLSQKYQFGITTKQIHDELRIFLQNDKQQSRPFPPMPKLDRKELHDLANALNLNSKSVGTGKNRFPVLVKTRRTLPYDSDMFNRVVSASESGWLDRDSRRGKKLGGKGNGKKAKGGFGGQAADATIRNGEVVGAGAAEIGKENFGHKLMEKMGWSKGMALGKEGEGRLMPVEQVMRAGRGGLGDSGW